MGTPARPRSNMPPNLSADLGDTPPKAKRAVTADTIHGPLEEGRKATLYDLGEAIRLVSLGWFKENALPPLPSALGNLSGVINKLKRSKKFCLPEYPDETEADKSRRLQASNNKEPLVWKSFNTQPSFLHGIDSIEDKVFKAIEDIAIEVGKAAQAILPAAQARQHVKFRCNPSMTLMSTVRDTSSRPDSYGVYIDHPSYPHRVSSKKVYWELAVAPGEFKKKNDADSRNDNVRKIMWSLNHIMREDVRRRFVVGYTIEDTDMRLWFCSRTDVFVSESFNFMTDHRNLAHFFLSLMYASESQLGYDTTIRYPHEVSLFGKQWDIDVRVWVPNPTEEATNIKRKGRGQARKAKGNDRDVDSRSDRTDGHGEGRGTWRVETYRTLKSLSNIGAEAIRGRGTRVWEASKLVVTKDGRFEPMQKSVVLKDSWIDDDRVREAVIRQQILDSAPTDIRQNLAKHLLTVECYGDVAYNESGVSTRDTTAHIRGGQPVPKDRYFTLETVKVVLNNPSRLPIGSDVPPNLALQPLPRIVEFDDKCHHRTVFKEVGRAADTLNSVSEVVRTLAQAVIALGLIHHCGWVHRDVSAGNILIVSNEAGDDVVKIADLEYAKRVSDKTRHSLRTGTVQYMAVEAERRKYLFVSKTTKPSADKVPRKGGILAALASHETSFSKTIAAPTVSNPAPTSAVQKLRALSYPFHHNPLHDVESVWWLAIRLTLVRLIAAEFLKNRDQHWNQEEASERARRQEHFLTSGFYNRVTRSDMLQSAESFASGQDIVHPNLLTLYAALSDVRQELQSAYLNAEKDIRAIDHTVGQDVSYAFYNILRELVDYYQASNDVQFEPIDGPVKKTTPEEHAALPPGTSLDSRLPGSNQSQHELGASLGPIPSSDAKDAVFGKYIGGAKRMKAGNAVAPTPVAGPSTIRGAASAGVNAPTAKGSEEVGPGTGKGKGKGKAKETATAKAPVANCRRTEDTPSRPLRRSTRVKKTTQP